MLDINGGYREAGDGFQMLLFNEGLQSERSFRKNLTLVLQMSGENPH
jgi:hypothetical protein